MRILMVSPHYDDVPLSLGQAMIDGALRPHRRTVGIVFGRTNWVQWFHPTRGRAPLVGAIRRTEETVAAARFRYRLRVARCEEAFLRLGTNDPGVYLDPTHSPADDPAMPGVLAAVRPWVEGADLSLFPLGIGDHIDHGLAAEAGRVLAAEGATVGFYEDRPYASLVPPEEITARAQRLRPDLAPVALSGPISAAKKRRLFYPSQSVKLFLDSFALDLDADSVERAWFPGGVAPLP